MKILIVTEVFYPENFLINDFAAEMVQRGHHVEVMTRQPSYPEGKVYPGYRNSDYAVEEWKGVTIHRFKTIEGYKSSKIKKVWNYLHYVRAGEKLILQIAKGMDVILVHQTGPLSLALPAVYARERLHIPAVVWTFDIWPDAVYMYGFPKLPPITWLVDWIIKRVYRHVDHVLVSSRMFADTIRRYAREQGIDYAPNWLIKSDEVQSGLRLPTQCFNFTFTGNISAAQNLERVIRGFVEAKIPNAVLNIVGDGSTKDAHQALVKELHAEEYVLFHGRWPYAEMQDILRQSDVLVLPLVSKAGIDKTEPFKIQSYLKAGKPIFGVLNGAGREIIEENKLGYCAHPDQIHDIAQGFKRMMTISEEEKEVIRKQSTHLMTSRFNREEIISQVENCLRMMAD